MTIPRDSAGNAPPAAWFRTVLAPLGFRGALGRAPVLAPLGFRGALGRAPVLAPLGFRGALGRAPVL
ncbi:MAG TPA: hypothetical protein VHZ32_11485, partial [Rhizomicrobium sp.]|nr:hypothetical protein [Rhizomicrobium sp.]